MCVCGYVCACGYVCVGMYEGVCECLGGVFMWCEESACMCVSECVFVGVERVYICVCVGMCECVYNGSCGFV